jgi:hypothetical protein
MWWKPKNKATKLEMSPMPVSMEEYLALLEKEIARLEEDYRKKIKLMNDLIQELRKEK